MMEVSSFPLSSLGLFWPPDGDRSSSSSSFLPQAKVNGIGSCNRRGEKGRRGPLFSAFHCYTTAAQYILASRNGWGLFVYT